MSPDAPLYSRLRFLPPSQFQGVHIKNAIIADGCRIGEGSMVENSIVGVRSQIGRNVTIRNSIVMGADVFQTTHEVACDREAGKPPIGIGDWTHIEGAIVDKNCRIGSRAQIRNALGVDHTDEIAGAMIADGIVVVVKDAVLPDGWRM
jgi:glucose-1-phosphate adenylyltransferase